MIIAKLSARRTLLYTTGVLVGAVLCSMVLLHHPDGVPLEEYANSKHFLGYETGLLGLIACAVLVVEQLITLGQLTFSASAIWTSDERIVCINPYWWPYWRKSFLCSAANTITQKSEGWYGKQGITVQLDDGRELFIPTWMCAEPCAEIFARINELIAQHKIGRMLAPEHAVCPTKRGVLMNFDIRQWFSGAARWVSTHLSLSSLIVVLLFFGVRFAFETWSIYDSIPSLPNGTLQIVEVSPDAAQFIVVDDHGNAIGGNRITVLVAFVKPVHFPEGTFRFEAKHELVDCSKRRITLQGAGFFDDQGRQTISRVFDEKWQPSSPPVAETKLVCDHADFGISRVVGYRAALIQAQAMVLRAFKGH